MNTTLILNSSEYLTSRYGQQLPEIVATVRDLGSGEAMFFSFCLFVTAVVFHELGHWIAILTKNKNARITVIRKGYGIQLRTGCEQDYLEMDRESKALLYVLGIALGLIPIGIAMLIHPIYSLVIPAYIVGCMNDFKLLFMLVRNKGEE